MPARDYRSSQELRLPIYEEIRKFLQVTVRVQPAAPYYEVKAGDARDAVLAAAEWILVVDPVRSADHFGGSRQVGAGGGFTLMAAHTSPAR
jgi:hypothetical protein